MSTRGCHARSSVPNGAPISVFSAYSLHYVGGVKGSDISADYYGMYCERLRELVEKDFPQMVSTAGDRPDAPRTPAIDRAPFVALMRTLFLLALGIVVLLLLATAATVVLSVRGALNTHRATLEIMHMMGSTDLQAARLFQRRVALDALFGGMVGLLAAVLLLWLLGNRFAALEPGLLADAGMPFYGWLILMLIPLAAAAIAMLTARWTVLSALKKTL